MFGGGDTLLCYQGMHLYRALFKLRNDVKTCSIFTPMFYFIVKRMVF